MGRAILDLRLSVTDRCNYRCVYCRTGNEGAVYSRAADRGVRARLLKIFRFARGGEDPFYRAASPCCVKGLLDLIRETARAAASVHQRKAEPDAAMPGWTWP